MPLREVNAPRGGAGVIVRHRFVQRAVGAAQRRFGGGGGGAVVPKLGQLWPPRHRR